MTSTAANMKATSEQEVIEMTDKEINTESTKETSQAIKTTIKVSASELPACCPPKDQAHWNLHPRVYIELEKSNQASCPYCGNRFELVKE